MDRTEAAIRTRATLEQWFVLVVVVLVAASAFGGWMAYTAYAAEPEADQETVELWSTTAGFQHSAEVQEGNQVFEAGEVMENQPLYYTRLSPEVDTEFVYRYDAPDGDVDVTIDLEQVIRSVDSDDGEYWSTSESVNQSTAQSVDPGDGQTASTTLSVPAIENESDRIESSFGDTPGTVETVLVAAVTMEGTIDGEDVTHTEQYELTLEPDGDTFSVDAPVGERYTEETTVTSEDETTAGLSDALAGIVLFVLSSSALVVLAVAKRRGTLGPGEAELEALRSGTERDRFDEWITVGSVPAYLRERPQIEVEDLEGLVDVAIDCDRRVIEDHGDDGPRFVVADDDVLYVYEQERNVIETERDVESASSESEVSV